MRLRIIVSGLIAQYPLGGVAWDYVQYAAGLARLGHDVYYVEDTGQWPYNPLEGGISKSCDFNVGYLADVMTAFGLEDRWAYRFPWQGQWFGLSDRRRREILETADLLVNVSGCLGDPDRYRGAKRMAFIDSDPVFTQLKLARGQEDFRRAVDLHDVHFSFGERLEAEPLDAVPDTGHHWHATRQPILMDQWRPGRPHREVLTTVMNWTSYKPIEFGGRTYGQKDIEFERFLDLPHRVAPAVLEVAMNEGKTRHPPQDLQARHGWRIVNPARVCPDPSSYREYIESSKAEWGVAKNGYVVGQPGWFSCRTACYLAAGRPAVVQDTGFSPTVPTGAGVLSFSELDEAVDAIREIEAHYAHHADAARQMAAEHFDADRVLGDLLEVASG